MKCYLPYFMILAESLDCRNFRVISLNTSEETDKISRSLTDLSKIYIKVKCNSAL